MDITSVLERKGYVATEHDVEQLAAGRFATSASLDRTDNAYLRILAAALQAQFGAPGAGRKRRLTSADTTAHLACLDDVHGRLYPHILKGVTTPEVAADESLELAEQRERMRLRNNRASFARSAASTLRTWISAGGDVRTLAVGEIMKSVLAAWVRSQRDPDTNPDVAVVGATARRLVGEARRLIEADPDAGRMSVEAAIAELQALLDVPFRQSPPAHADPTPPPLRAVSITRRQRTHAPA